MDSGARESIVHESLISINKFNTRQTSTSKWSMMANCFRTSREAKDKIKLPELKVSAHILAPLHVTN